MAIMGAGLAYPYAGFLIGQHYVANVLFAAASFAVQAFAAVVVARLVCRTGPRAALLPFARTLVPLEVMFTALTALGVLGIAARGVGAVIMTACLLWQIGRTARFYRDAAASWARGVGGAFLHYAVIAILVAGYAHALDLFPYPPGVP